MPRIRAAVLSPVEGTFVYDLPDEMASIAVPGARLRLPFGRSLREGFLVDFHGEAKPGIKPVAEVLPEALSISGELLELTRWVSEYYFAPWGEVLMAAVPATLGRRPTRRGSAKAAADPGDAPGAAASGAAGAPAFEPGGMHVPPRPAALTADQSAAIAAIGESLRRGGFEAHLLEGVTGSGKTEVYLCATEQVVRAGGQALVLVPEIALSPLLYARFAARFPGRVVAQHSRQTDRERRESWLRARRGEADVVLGVRSGVFAPLPNLRLVVVDEEHEPSYKQLEGLLYHARDVAVKRAQLAGAVVVLGSATPSLESRANVAKGRYRRLRLPVRVDHRPLPRVEIVDLREREQLRRSQVLSEPLLGAMEECLSRNEQIILFLNRRGFASALHCRSCGELARCPSCDVTLTLHQGPAELRCHYCGRHEPVWSACPGCNGLDLRPAGAGTQRVETELGRLFPGVPLVRMDLDTTRGRTSHADLLGEFEKRRASILLGTQMVAKGHDFPGVTLVGVVLADVQLFTPDFRSGERTFQLLTQVAGRAGRGDQPGRVIFQTYLPSHPAIVAAREHDGEAFYAAELEERQAFHFPPAVRMVSFRLSGRDEAGVRAAAEALAGRAAAHPASAQVGRLGPAPAPIARIRNTWRYHLLLRSGDLKSLRTLAGDLWQEARRPPKGIRIDIDVDPIETG